MEISIALHGDFGVVLDDGVMTPNDVLERLNEEIKMGVCQIKVAHTQSGERRAWIALEVCYSHREEVLCCGCTWAA